MIIKNLIIQYGQCQNNCSYCYLKNQNIKLNKTKFWSTISNIKNCHKVENLFISYQGNKFSNKYQRIIKILNADNNTLTTRMYSNINFDNKTKQIFSVENEIYNFAIYPSYYLDNSEERYNILIRILEKIKLYHGNPIYITLDKYHEIDYVKLFKLYTDYPDIIELDSCLKRIINNKTCNDIHVLNEDGNIYTCPYTTKYKDSDFLNQPKICPYIRL
jgi:hypothetical protein